MKKIFSVILSVMMVCAFSFGEVGQVFAAQTGPGTLEDAISSGKIKESKKDCMPNAAIVLFKVTKKKVTKTQTKKALASGKNSVSDITVKDLWTFSPKPELTTNSSGKRKLVRTNSKGKEYVRVALVKSESMSTDELVRTFSKRSDVKYAEPNYKITAQSVTEDEYSDYQWSMQGTEEQPSDVAPNVKTEWDKSQTTGSDNIVAVLDSGVDYTHPDLKDNMWENTHYPVLKGECGYDFINGDDDPMDDNGHGTHCAGIIGARGDNDIGISGVNKNVKIMALKMLDEEGSAYLAHEVAAYNYIDRALDLGEPVKAINNSWGGGDFSAVLADLIDIVGEKGAISVIAAGNDGVDCDEEADYPVCIDSPYMIVVAAEREDGELVNFSNYGKKTVDIAAPGTDILSTVSYGSYNPTIYGEKQADYSAKFNDYEGPNNELEKIATVNKLKKSVYLNGEKIDSKDLAANNIIIEKAQVGFNPGNADGTKHSVLIEVKNRKPNDLICIPIEYDISKDAKHAPIISTMTENIGDGLLGILDLKRGSDLSLDALGDMPLLVAMNISKDFSDNWVHMDARTLNDEELKKAKEEAEKDGETGSLKREAVLIIYSGNGGNASVWLDDIGLSKEDVASENTGEFFGKYDFMSGTSMAAPYVSGAVALKAAELEKKGASDPETLINEIVSSVKLDEDIPVLQKGHLDFTQRPEQLPPRAGKITVNQSNNTLTIHGSGLENTAVKLGDDEDSLENAEVTNSTDRAVTVKNKDWINNIKTAEVSREDGTSFRRDVYMVNGKKTIGDPDDAAFIPTGAMTTDATRIYWADKESSSFCVAEPASEESGVETFAAIDPDEIFKIKKNKNEKYSMEFGSDLIYLNGSLFSVLEYGPSDEVETVEDDWDSASSIYSSEFRLVKTEPAEEGNTVVSLGKLPDDLEKTTDYAMTAYNGKLYFIGGYSYAKGSKGITTKVWIYGPNAKKWSAGPALPEGRAGGKAIQSGGELIYTLGYSAANTGEKIEDQKHPANLIFDGSKWRKSSVAADKNVEPLVINGSVNHGGNAYIQSSGDVSLVKSGVFYTGTPAAGYGDMFTYAKAGDSFADTGYNFINIIDDQEIRGIAVGNTLYGFAEDKMYRLPVSGGQINVKTSASKHGSIKGAGSYMPGNTADVLVQASKYYKIKTLKVNGKKVTLKKNQTKHELTFSDLVSDQNIAASFVKYKFKVKIKKKGKGKVTGGKVYVKGKTAKIKVKAKKGWYIKSIKAGKKKIKVKKNARKKTFKIKKIKKDVTVKVVFKKIKKK